MAQTNGNGIPRHPVVWWSRLKTKWPLLIWLGAIGLMVVLYQHEGKPLDLVGVLHIPEENAAIVETARLAEVPVSLGQTVEPGQVLARFEVPAMESELAIERLRVERQFVELVQGAETALREARLEQARDEAELSALTAELERLQALREQNLIDDQDLARVRAPRQALLKAVELYPEFIAHLERQLNESRGLREAVAAQASDDTQMQELLAQRQSQYTVRANGAGTVAAILRQPGDVVAGGDAVVTLLQDVPATVVGYLREDDPVDLRADQEVYLRTWGSRDISIPGRVVSISPTIVQLPIQLQRMPRQIIRGRPVVILPSEPLNAVPGELVGISLRPAPANPLRVLLAK